MHFPDTLWQRTDLNIGNLDVRPSDVAQALGDPSLIRTMVVHRWALTGVELANAAALGFRTAGAFEIGTPRGVAMLAGGIGGQMAVEFARTRLEWSLYRKVTNPWILEGYKNSPKYWESLSNTQVSQGVPSFHTGEHAMRRVGIELNKPLGPQIVGAIAEPIAQVIAAAPYVGIAQAALGLGIAYSGIVLGKHFDSKRRILDTEHRMTRDAARQTSGAAQSRFAIFDKSIITRLGKNIAGYARQENMEALARNVPTMGMLGVMMHNLLTRPLETLGIASYFLSLSGSATKISDLLKEASLHRINRQSALIFAEFSKSNFTSDSHWQGWAKYQTYEPSIESRFGEVARLDHFTADYSDLKLPTASISIFENTVIHLKGASGDGKSAVCAAMSAEIPHQGIMMIQDNDRLVDIRTLAQSIIKEKVIHFSPGHMDRLAGRASDLFKDSFILSLPEEEQRAIFDSETLTLAMLVNDVDLETQLQLYSHGDNDIKTSGKALGKLSEKDIGYLSQLQERRREFVHKQANQYGITQTINMLAPISELSTGMKLRLLVASAMTNLRDSAKILIFDEPSSALDEKSARILYETIADIRSRLQLAVIIVSHHHDEIIQQAFDKFGMGSYRPVILSY